MEELEINAAGEVVLGSMSYSVMRSARTSAVGGRRRNGQNNDTVVENAEIAEATLNISKSSEEVESVIAVTDSTTVTTTNTTITTSRSTDDEPSTEVTAMKRSGTSTITSAKEPTSTTGSEQPSTPPTRKTHQQVADLHVRQSTTGESTSIVAPSTKQTTQTTGVGSVSEPAALREGDPDNVLDQPPLPPPPPVAVATTVDDSPVEVVGNIETDENNDPEEVEEAEKVESLETTTPTQIGSPAKVGPPTTAQQQILPGTSSVQRAGLPAKTVSTSEVHSVSSESTRDAIAAKTDEQEEDDEGDGDDDDDDDDDDEAVLEPPPPPPQPETGLEGDTADVELQSDTEVSEHNSTSSENDIVDEASVVPSTSQGEGSVIEAERNSIDERDTDTEAEMESAADDDTVAQTLVVADSDAEHPQPEALHPPPPPPPTHHQPEVEQQNEVTKSADLDEPVLDADTTLDEHVLEVAATSVEEATVEQALDVIEDTPADPPSESSLPSNEAPLEKEEEPSDLDNALPQRANDSDNTGRTSTLLTVASNSEEEPLVK